MNQHNNPPFAISQRIVALRDQADGDFKEGDQFVVENLSQCPKCKIWVVDIGKRTYEPAGVFWDLCFCGYKILMHSNSVTIWYTSDLFAPIITKRDHSNVEIAEEIKRLPVVEERSDVKKKEVVV